jgi:hypothetical protein
MAIPVTCGCGKAYRLKDELAGRKIRCVGCQAVVAVPQPEPTADLDEDTMVTEDAPRPRPRRPAPPPSEAVQAEVPRPRPRAAGPEPSKPARKERERATRDSETRDREPRYRESRERHRRRSSGSLAPNRTLVTGLLMIVGAVVWFGVGLLGGVIFFYPPVLFVLGVVATAKGMMGYQDD